MFIFLPVFLFLKFIYFNWRLFYNIVLVLPYINMNPPWVYMCSPSWTSLHLPPHTIPQGHPSAPVPSIQYHALNLDWRFVSHMILYMFQCYSPKSSHSRPLPQSLRSLSLAKPLFKNQPHFRFFLRPSLTISVLQEASLLSALRKLDHPSFVIYYQPHSFSCGWDFFSQTNWWCLVLFNMVFTETTLP